MKIIALRSQQESYEEPYFYIYFEVPENFELDVEKFEKDFSEVYNRDDFEFDWNYAFYETAKKYGLDKEIYLDVIDLTI
jgi:hypothetical protein